MYAALQYAASVHCCLVEEWKDCEELKPKAKEKWRFVDKRSEEKKHRMECCAEADRYRCMRCGRGSKYMKMPGSYARKMHRTKVPVKKFWKMGRRHLGGHDFVTKMDRHGEAQKVFGIREAKNGTEVNELL